MKPKGFCRAPCRLYEPIGDRRVRLLRPLTCRSVFFGVSLEREGPLLPWRSHAASSSAIAAESGATAPAGDRAYQDVIAYGICSQHERKQGGAFGYGPRSKSVIPKAARARHSHQVTVQRGQRANWRPGKWTRTSTSHPPLDQGFDQTAGNLCARGRLMPDVRSADRQALPGLAELRLHAKWC